MNELIKTAANNDYKNLIKTAGILRMLKNKIKSMFDADSALKAEELVKKTEKIKPLLADTYRLIKKIENAINDFEIEEYETNIILLKEKVNTLNTELNKVSESTENQEEAKETIPIKKDKRQRESNLPEGATLYKNAKTLSDLGVTFNDIKESKRGPSGIYSSENLVNIIKREEDPAKLEGNKHKISDDAIRNIFYTKIPNMKIVGIMPRELKSGGEKKSGYLEVKVLSELESLPAPFENWKLRVLFYLVDLRKSQDEKLRFGIYRQLVINVVNSSKGQYYKIDNPNQDPSKDSDNRTTTMEGYNA